MCFSAQISFLSSALLVIIGLFAINRISDKKQILLALIPLLFSLQQFAEGIVWLTEPNSFTNIIFAYIYLTFAMIVWPLWMPISLLVLEKIKNRKIILMCLLAVGILWSIFAITQAFIRDLVVNLGQSHVNYMISSLDNYRGLLTLIYLIPGTLPFFVSSIKNSYIIGLALVISCLLSYVIWYNFFISLWCFFAALLSIIVLFVIDNVKQAKA